MHCVLPKPRAPRVYREDEFRNDELIPTVIFVEYRDSSQIIAGVWQIDHYELENGRTLMSPWDEIEKWKGSYNAWWRIWDILPTDDDRGAIPWKPKESSTGKGGIGK